MSIQYNRVSGNFTINAKYNLSIIVFSDAGTHEVLHIMEDDMDSFIGAWDLAIPDFAPFLMQIGYRVRAISDPTKPWAENCYEYYSELFADILQLVQSLNEPKDYR